MTQILDVINNLAFLKYAHLGMIFVFIEIIIYDKCVNDQLVTSSSYQWMSLSMSVS